MFGHINWRQLGRLVVTICLVQAAYWGLIDKPLFQADRANAPEMAEISEVEIARLANPSPASTVGAKFERVDLPWTYCCDTAIHAVRMKFAIDNVPSAGLGLISTLQVDNYIAYVNGSKLVGEGRMEPPRATFHGQKMFLTRVPAGLLRPGENQLTYIVVRDGFPYTDISAPLIGEYDAMSAFSANRLWNTNEFHRYAAGFLGLLGMLAAIMIVRAQDWHFAAWLSVLCAAFVSNYLYAIMLDPPFDGWGRMVAFFVVNMAAPVAMLCFIDAWTGRPVRQLQISTILIYGLTIGYVSWSIYRAPMPEGFDVPAEVWTWFLMIFAVASAVRMMWHFAREAETRVFESALLSVCVVAILMDGAGTWFPHFGEGNLNNAAPFLMLAMLTAFLARNFRLFQSQAALNTLLQEKVTQREAELATAHAREQELVRQQAYDAERRRIMQDIHDGLGSQLMSMLLSARLGEAEPAQVAEGLQAVIDEMRLMVDSMDSVGESLESALATFRARMQPRIASAGLQFDWQQDADLPFPDYGPRDVLQLFRILQEAVTNALKHSGATALGIAVTRQTASTMLITVTDNGRGNAQAGVGRGMGNMTRRAEAIGATFTLTSDPAHGTRISLCLSERIAEIA